MGPYMIGNIWMPMGGVHAVCCSSAAATYSIIDLEANPMLAVLLMLLRTDEEREQFAQFYRQYEHLMYKTARQILDTQQDCEDVVQTSCAYLIDHLEKFSSYTSQQVAVYLVLLIRNRSKDLRNRQNRIVFEDVENFTEASAVGCENDSSLLLEIAFEQLSERYKEALTLYYYNGLSIKEMAAFLQLSEAATKKLLQRSRDALRNALKAEGGVFE